MPEEIKTQKVLFWFVCRDFIDINRLEMLVSEDNYQEWSMPFTLLISAEQALELVNIGMKSITGYEKLEVTYNVKTWALISYKET